MVCLWSATLTGRCDIFTEEDVPQCQGKTVVQISSYWNHCWKRPSKQLLCPLTSKHVKQPQQQPEPEVYLEIVVVGALVCGIAAPRSRNVFSLMGIYCLTGREFIPMFPVPINFVDHVWFGALQRRFLCSILMHTSVDILKEFPRVICPCAPPYFVVLEAQAMNIAITNWRQTFFPVCASSADWIQWRQTNPWIVSWEPDHLDDGYLWGILVAYTKDNRFCVKTHVNWIQPLESVF